MFGLLLLCSAVVVDAATAAADLLPFEWSFGPIECLYVGWLYSERCCINELDCRSIDAWFGLLGAAELCDSERLDHELFLLSVFVGVDDVDDVVMVELIY